MMRTLLSEIEKEELALYICSENGIYFLKTEAFPVD